MNVLARFLRFVIWVVVLSWIFKLVGRFAMWALRRAVDPGQRSGNAGGNATENPERVAGAAGAPQLATRHLVRDPVCGMHLAETLAIPYRHSGQLVHFCSVDCRDKYASGILRRAANA
jgi:YHS domain-containing protein